jgi:hypothetical protein
MKPIYIHSGMGGAPQYANADGNVNAILEACLVNGFNTKTATSASASGGILTLNFSADPQFEALQTVEVAVSSVPAVNGVHRVIANSSNQVTIAIAGLADGTVGSSGAGITIKQAGAGWSKPFSSATKAVFRPPAGARRYLQCEFVAGGNLKARGYEDMTAIEAGTMPFPTLSQASDPLAMYLVGYGVSASAPWFVIATDKWVIFSFANAIVPNYSAGFMFFGDLAEQVKPGDEYATVLFGQSGGFICRDSFADPIGSISCTLNFGASGGTWPSPILGGLRLLPYISVHETYGQMRGVLPSTYKSMPAAPGSDFLNIYSNVIGLSGRAKPVGLQGASSALMGAIAIDEEAWT